MREGANFIPWRAARVAPALAAVGFLTLLPAASLAGARDAGSPQTQTSRPALPPAPQTTTPAEKPAERPAETPGLANSQTRYSTFLCMARAAHTLFSQTEKDRRADPRSVYRRILSGFYAEQVREKCSAEPGIGLFDDDDIRDTIKGTAFKDWIDAQNQKMSQELKKADEWFDPESDRLIKAYIGCLFASVRAMAVLSDEDAETIVKAAVPACRAQAEQLRTMFRKYADEPRASIWKTLAERSRRATDTRKWPKKSFSRTLSGRPTFFSPSSKSARAGAASRTKRRSRRRLRSPNPNLTKRHFSPSRKTEERPCPSCFSSELSQWWLCRPRWRGRRPKRRLGARHGRTGGIASSPSFGGSLYDREPDQDRLRDDDHQRDEGYRSRSDDDDD